MELRRSDLAWIDRAAAEARKATGTHKLGAVIVSGNRLLATGFNRKRNDPRYCEAGWSIHAEVSAIRRLRNKPLPPKPRMYVVRVMRTGKLGLAKPCEDCDRSLTEYGIHTLIYTTNEGAHLA